MRTLTLLALAVALAAGPACNKSSSSAAESTENVALKTLTIDEVAARLSDPKTFIFDNNNADRYKKGHVPHAKWVAASAVTAAVLPADKGATLVFYCADEECTACHTGAKAALALGYTSVYIMPSGIAGWEKSGKPVEV